jgi:hypothetical protein
LVAGEPGLGVSQPNLPRTGSPSAATQVFMPCRVNK